MLDCKCARLQFAIAAMRSVAYHLAVSDLRAIPSIEQLRQRPAIRALEAQYGAAAAVDALRAGTDAIRKAIAAGGSRVDAQAVTEPNRGGCRGSSPARVPVVASARDQRHRRRAAHQPRTRAARRCRDRSGRRSRLRLLDARIRPGRREPGPPRRPCRRAALPPDRRRGRRRGQQQRGGDDDRPGRPRRRPRSGRLARRAGRDRGRVPGAGRHGAVGSGRCAKWARRTRRGWPITPPRSASGRP